MGKAVKRRRYCGKISPLCSQVISDNRINTQTAKGLALEGPKSRGQRKRMKKKQRMAGRAALEKSILSAKSIQMDKAMNGIFCNVSFKQNIESALPEISQTEVAKKKDERPDPVRLTSKQKHRSIASELSQMVGVFTHESFKRDPVGALTQHLLNTVAKGGTGLKESLEEEAIKTHKRECEKRALQRKKRKEEIRHNRKIAKERRALQKVKYKGGNRK